MYVLIKKLIKRINVYLWDSNVTKIITVIVGGTKLVNPSTIKEISISHSMTLS